MTDKTVAQKIFSDLDNIGNFAIDLQEALKNKEITIERGDISITILGNQEVKNVLVGGVPDENMRLAIEDAIQKSQKLAADTMSGLPQNSTLDSEEN